MLAAATILFYDYLLTLGDEVSRPIGVTIYPAYYHGERSNLLGMVRNHGVRREHHLAHLVC